MFELEHRLSHQSGRSERSARAGPLDGRRYRARQARLRCGDDYRLLGRGV